MIISGPRRRVWYGATNGESVAAIRVRNAAAWGGWVGPKGGNFEELIVLIVTPGSKVRIF